MGTAGLCDQVPPQGTRRRLLGITEVTSHCFYPASRTIRHDYLEANASCSSVIYYYTNLSVCLMFVPAAAALGADWVATTGVR